MNPKLLKIAFRHAIKRVARQNLTGRNRDRLNPAKGRFTTSEVKDILNQVWERYDQLALKVPPAPRLGNRMNLLLACVTLACFQVLSGIGIERGYAIELIGDMAWKVYEKWGRIPLFVTRLRSSDPRKRLRMAVNLFLRFPFTPPGYVFNRIDSSEGISLDMSKCPVSDYLVQEEAADLCTQTWCNLDFALAEMWGGWLERTETLAQGSHRCDFRFKASPIG